jgi:predicted secreted protein
MRWTSMLAIYTLFWVMTAFVVLPFGIRSHHEAGVELLPGQSDGAPANFRPGRVMLWTTLVSAVLFGLFYANYLAGWITADALNLFGQPPGPAG